LDTPENQAYVQPVYAALRALEREYLSSRRVANAAVAYRDCQPEQDDALFEELVASVQEWELVQAGSQR
jgi:hypothetical protein